MQSSHLVRKKASYLFGEIEEKGINEEASRKSIVDLERELQSIVIPFAVMLTKLKYQHINVVSSCNNLIL